MKYLKTTIVTIIFITIIVITWNNQNKSTEKQSTSDKTPIKEVVLENANFMESEFFGDFSGKCFREQSCPEVKKMTSKLPMGKMKEIEFTVLPYYEKETNDEFKALHISLFKVVGNENTIGTTVPIYPIGNYAVGDSIDYQTGFKIEIIGITNLCREVKLTWSDQSRDIKVCEGEGLVGELVL